MKNLLDILKTVAKKGKNAIVVGGTLLALGGLAGKADAVDVRGFFIGSPNCSLEVYRKPTGSRDTLKTRTGSNGNWVIETNNFIPPAVQGETLYVYGGWDLGGKAKTFDILTTSPKPYLDLNLNKFTGCIGDVIDTSQISGTLNAIYRINGFAPCTTVVDTGINQGFTFWDDVHAPFDTTQAVQGRQGNIRLEKRNGNTVYWTDIPFIVDKTRFDAQLIRDSVYFPQNYSGVEQELSLSPQRKGHEWRVWPSVTQGIVNVTGTKGFSTYNAAGQKVGKYQNSNANSTGIINFSPYPNGVYFLRTEDMGQETKKVVKVW